MKDAKTYKFFPFAARDKKFQQIIYKNRCVLVPLAKDAWPQHMCGYAVFKKTDIPKDWWGNYNAPGLQQLLVHGGITYCRQFEVPNQKNIERRYERKIDKLYADNKMEAMKRMNAANKLREEMNLELSKSDEGYVVFGFDCGHYQDAENPLLKDPNHVMILTEQMESQLMKFKDSYEQYRDAEGVVKNVVRKSIMENVHREADIRLEPGFGAMIDMLSGEGDE